MSEIEREKSPVKNEGESTEKSAFEEVTADQREVVREATPEVGGEAVVYDDIIENDHLAVIKVIGVGGGGGNAVRHMMSSNLQGVQFYAVNTDVQALRDSSGATQIQIGAELTGGLGAGSDPTLGRRAAENDKDKLEEIVIDSDMVFVTAGMGGGTGTGAAPMIARLSKESEALTIAVVTKPFEFEGRRRIIQAERGLEELKEYSDAIIVIPNQRLLDQVERQTPIREAFRMADDVLLQGVKGISDLITIPGAINLDFADVKTTMFETGKALLGIGNGAGANRAETAAKDAISCPLLEDTSIEGATGILVNFTGGDTMTLHEVQQAMEIIQGAADEEVDIIFGLVYDEELEEEIRVTVIATGFDQRWKKEPKSPVGGDAALDLDTILGRTFDRGTTRSTQSTSRKWDELSPPAREQEAAVGKESRGAIEEPLDVPTYLRFGKSKKKK